MMNIDQASSRGCGALCERECGHGLHEFTAGNVCHEFFSGRRRFHLRFKIRTPGCSLINGGAPICHV